MRGGCGDHVRGGRVWRSCEVGRVWGSCEGREGVGIM